MDIKNILINFLKRNVLLWILILLVVVLSIMSPDFFSVRNLFNICLQNSYLIIASIGVGIVMIAGGTDLSSGMMISVVAVCTGAFMEWLHLPIPIAIVLGLVVGILLGLFNGFAANLLGIHSMIVTLATMTMFQGISYLISGSKSFFDLDPSFKMIGQGYVFSVIPIPVVIVVVVALVAHFVLTRTVFGRFIFASGGNPEAARLAGINVKRIKLIVFAMCGLLCALASVVMVSRQGSANSTMGGDVVFNAITACVLGGISFIGGEGDVKGVVIAVLILGVLSNGMQLIGMGVYIQYVIKAIILLASIGYDTYQKKAKVKKILSTKQIAA